MFKAHPSPLHAQTASIAYAFEPVLNGLSEPGQPSELGVTPHLLGQSGAVDGLLLSCCHHCKAM